MRKLNQKHINQMIFILVVAKLKIRDEHEEFICHALRTDWCKNPLFYNVNLEKYLIKWVEKMLDGNETLDCWYFFNLKRTLSLKRGKQVRMRWIDWMIKELKKELK